MKEYQNKTRTPKKQNLCEESELWQWASERHKKALREYAEKEINQRLATQNPRGQREIKGQVHKTSKNKKFLSRCFTYFAI